MEVRADHAADDVLAAVLLHMVKAALPVDIAFHGGTCDQGSIAGVDDDALFFVDVQHLYAAQTSGVGRLATALGIKGSAVKDDEELTIFAGLTVQNRGGKAAQIRVLLIEFFDHRIAPFGESCWNDYSTGTHKLQRYWKRKDPGECITRVDVCMDLLAFFCQ